eukprot:2578951-Lingulodinium_polyedra.AAC.1
MSTVARNQLAMALCASMLCVTLLEVRRLVVSPEELAQNAEFRTIVQRWLRHSKVDNVCMERMLALTRKAAVTRYAKPAAER